MLARWVLSAHSDVIQLREQHFYSPFSDDQRKSFPPKVWHWDLSDWFCSARTAQVGSVTLTTSTIWNKDCGCILLIAGAVPVLSVPALSSSALEALSVCAWDFPPLSRASGKQSGFCDAHLSAPQSSFPRPLLHAELSGACEPSLSPACSKMIPPFVCREPVCVFRFSLHWIRSSGTAWSCSSEWAAAESYEAGDEFAAELRMKMSFGRGLRGPAGFLATLTGNRIRSRLLQTSWDKWEEFLQIYYQTQHRKPIKTLLLACRWWYWCITNGDKDETPPPWAMRKIHGKQWGNGRAMKRDQNRVFSL